MERLALVTGSSRGIGRATAIALARAGARVVLTSRGGDDLKAAAREVAGAGPEPRVETCDFGFAGQIEALFDRLDSDGEAVDVLVNNVGAGRMGDFLDVPDTEWTILWELNVMSAVRCTRRVLPGMRERHWGRIVNVSSSAGIRPSARWPHYAPTKAALQALTMVLADGYAKDGVTVNAVCPGPTLSPTWTAGNGLAASIAEAQGTTSARVLEAVGGRIPAGRMGEPGEIGAAIVFLASEEASFVNGAVLSVDGGNVHVTA
ncbi:MAG: SDR family NAD(P)-dependent oxidoreductase [Gemmatimonadota bacterium]